MVEEQNETQVMQNKADRLKLLNLASNIHNLTPPQQHIEDPSREIALVNVLSVSKRVQDKYLEIRGLIYDEKKKIFMQMRKPIMNDFGAFKFCQVLRMAEEIEWASYSEEEINSRIIHFYESNLPEFTFSEYEEYNIDENDFDYIENTLKVFIDSCFHKSKQGKYINTLGRTYDEGVLKRAIDGSSPNNTKREEGFLRKINPFRER